MSWYHLFFGILLFVVFTITGQYMRADFPDKLAIEQEFRMLMRSRHIYILFSALIHLALGMYMQLHGDRWRRATQYAGSSVLFASSLILVWAFVAEVYQFRGFSDISRYGVYTSLTGVALHLLANAAKQRVAP